MKRMSVYTVKQPYESDLSAGSVQRHIRVVHQLDLRAWRQFVEQHPQGNIFHTPEMFQVFEQANGFSPMLWAVVRDDEQIEALFIPVRVTLNKYLGPLTTRAISYGSVLCLPTDNGRQALAILLNTYTRETRGSCLFTELRNISDIKDEQSILHEQGFAYEAHLNYLIDLKPSPEQVFLNIGARTRKGIKHGLNKGEVTFQEVTRVDQLNACYNLLRQTYQTAKVPLADRSLFEAAFDLLYPQKMIRILLAYIGDVPVSVSYELLYKDVVTGWYGGTDRAYGKYVPYDLLMWQILKWGSENGYHLYDFGGAGKPDEEYGVRDHKAKFGGELVCYGRNTFVHLPGVLWLSKKGYQVMRHLFDGRFPGLRS